MQRIDKKSKGKNQNSIRLSSSEVAGVELVVITGQILQVSPVFHSPRGANFPRVWDACTAPNKGNFVSFTIMLNYLIEQKGLDTSFLFIKVIVMLLFCWVATWDCQRWFVREDARVQQSRFLEVSRTMCSILFLKWEIYWACTKKRELLGARESGEGLQLLWRVSQKDVLLYRVSFEAHSKPPCVWVVLAAFWEP